MIKEFTITATRDKKQIIEHETGNHFEMFKHLLSFWQLSKKYNPMEIAA